VRRRIGQLPKAVIQGGCRRPIFHGKSLLEVVPLTARQLVVFEDAKKQIVKALDAFENIKDFEDVERVFLRGQGLSPNTYRTYRQAIKTFYE